VEGQINCPERFTGLWCQQIVLRPFWRVPVRFQQARLPGLLDVGHFPTHEVPEYEVFRLEVLARRIGLRELQNARQTRRDGDHAPCLSLRPLCQDGHLSSLEVHIPPRQGQQLALAAAALEGADDQALKVRPRVLQQLRFFVWLQPSIPLRVLPAFQHVRVSRWVVRDNPSSWPIGTSP